MKLCSKKFLSDIKTKYYFSEHKEINKSIADLVAKCLSEIDLSLSAIPLEWNGVYDIIIRADDGAYHDMFDIRLKSHIFHWIEYADTEAQLEIYEKFAKDILEKTKKSRNRLEKRKKGMKNANIHCVKADAKHPD